MRQTTRTVEWVHVLYHLTLSLGVRSLHWDFALFVPATLLLPGGLGRQEERGTNTLSCPVLPPNHILRSGNLADILGTSCSVIMKFQRIPKNLETACSSSWCLREETAEGAAQIRFPGLFFELLSAPRRAGDTKQSYPQRTVGAPQDQVRNSALSGGIMIIWDCGYQGTPVTE